MTNQVNQYERHMAIQEAYQIHDSDEYFKARPQLECGDRRKVFYAGHIRGYQAATKASEIEINALKERVAELESELFVLQELRKNQATLGLELTASNNRLREALDKCKYDCHTGEVIGIAEKALKATPTQSLAEHDNATIDRCKNIVADDALAITFQSMGAYRSAIIKQICELKVTP